MLASRKTISSLLLASLAVAWLAVKANAQMELNDSRLLPYAGRLESGGGPASGLHDFHVGLFRSNDVVNDSAACLAATTPSCSNAIWTESIPAVSVNTGTFAMVLGEHTPITDTMLNETSLWLAIAVKGPSDTTYTLLSGRQHILPVAHAARAAAAKDYRVTGKLLVGGCVEQTDSTNGRVFRTCANNGVEITPASDPGATNAVLRVRAHDNTTRLAVHNNDAVVVQEPNGVILQTSATSSKLKMKPGVIDATLSDGTTETTLTIDSTTTTMSSDVYVTGNMTLNGELHLAANAPIYFDAFGGNIAVTDSSPADAHKLTACTERGRMQIRPVTVSGSTQDSLCICLRMDGNLEEWCFNP